MLIREKTKPEEEGKMYKKLSWGIMFFLVVTILLTGYSEQIAASTRTVICPSGAKVVVPPADEINRVVMTSVPLPSAYRLIEKDLSKLVGINPGSKEDAKNSILSKIAPEILNISDSFMKGSEVNVEELLKLKPDVIFYYGGFTKQAELYSNLGIPAIDTRPKKRGNALEMMICWVKVLGEVFEKETDIENIINHGIEVMKEIKEKTARFEDDKKTRALVLFRISEKEIIVSGKGNQGDSWLNLTGAINVAGKINGTSNANMEQIYKWNPEVIYIFNNAMPEDLLDNKIKGQDWSEIKAVKNNRVYKIPVGIARWFPPSADAPLMLQWMAQKNYPQVFSYYQMEREIKDYYQKFYKYDISDEAVFRILHPIREKAMVRGQGENF